MSGDSRYINETLRWVINAIKQDENISEDFRNHIINTNGDGEEQEND